MMDDPAEAEEVLQETFLQAVKHINNFRGQSKLGTWLYRIATNQALMKLRRKRPINVSLDDTEMVCRLRISCRWRIGAAGRNRNS